MRAVLGLPGAEGGRAPILPLQYGRAARLMRTQVLAQAIAALATLWLYRPYADHVLLLCWLGLVAATGATSIVLAKRKALADVPKLAITLEPAGGSPSGQPTGPIVMSGNLFEI